MITALQINNRPLLHVGLALCMLLAACSKSGTPPPPSSHWVEVRVHLDSRFNVAAVKRIVLVADSLTPQGEDLSQSAECAGLKIHEGMGCTSECRDYDRDGHREFVMTCPVNLSWGEGGGRWSTRLYGDGATAVRFKVRAEIYSTTVLIGAGEERSDSDGAYIAINMDKNPAVDINIACIPGISCSLPDSGSCAIGTVTGPLQVTVDEGTVSRVAYWLDTSSPGGVTWEVRLPSGENPPGWISLIGSLNTTTTLDLAPTVGTAATAPSTELLLQVADRTCSKSFLVTVSVNETNQAPRLMPLPTLIVPAGRASSYLIDAHDADPGDQLTFTLSGAPDWMVIAPVADALPRQAWLVLLPRQANIGAFGPFNLTVKDSAGLSDTLGFSVEVKADFPNHAPVLNPVGNLTVSDGSAVTVILEAADRDAGDRLTFSLHHPPDWAGLTRQSDRSTTLSLAPPMGTRGNWSGMEVRVSDPWGALDHERLTILVNSADGKPVLAPVVDLTVEEGAAAATEFEVSAEDPDADDTLTFALKNRPDWVTLVHANAVAGKTRVRILAPGGSAGVYPGVVLLVRDRAGLIDSKRFTLTVSDTNSAPVLQAIGNRACSPGETTAVPLAGHDPDGDRLTFELEGTPPAWLVLSDAEAGDNRAVLNCAPPAGTSGLFPVTVRVKDTHNSHDRETFDLVVGTACHAPVLSTVGRQHLFAGEVRRLTVQAADRDQGEVLAFSLLDSPHWARLVDAGAQSASLILSPPGSLGPGTYSAGTLKITDSCPARPLSDTEQVEVVIGEANRCPEAGAVGEQTVREGEIASVTIHALDRDGDRVTCMLDGMSPSWVSVGETTWNESLGTGSCSVSFAPPLGNHGGYGVTLLLVESGARPCTTPLSFVVQVASSSCQILAVQCQANGQCCSGHCVDGLCCDKSCGKSCQSCAQSGRLGRCTPFTAGTDPEDDCPACQVCNGGESCQNAMEGTDPAGECNAFACNGQGACHQSCNPATNQGCRTGATCNVQGQCVGLLAKGLPCVKGEECLSAFCSDGVCCDGPCQSACQSCNNAGRVGSCLAVADAEDPDSCTGERSCDSFGQCRMKPGKACGANGQCSSGHCVRGVCCDRRCDGVCEACDLGGKEGLCTPVIGAEDPDSCKGKSVCDPLGRCKLKDLESCASDGQCASGHCKLDYNNLGGWCSEAMLCVHNGQTYTSGSYSQDCYDARGRARCVDGAWLFESCGTDGPCAEYSCSQGACSAVFHQTDHLCDATFRCTTGEGDGHYGELGDYRCQGFCDGNGACDFAGNCQQCSTGQCSGSCPGCTFQSGCSAGACYAGSSEDTDKAKSYCEACGLTWLSNASVSGNSCCGDDDGEEIVQTPGPGRKCCYNGAVLESGAAQGSVLCHDGQLFDCNDGAADDGGLAAVKTTCAEVGALVCRGDNSWGLAANGCPCTANALCHSGQCKEDYDGQGRWCAAANQCVHDGDFYENDAEAPECLDDNFRRFCINGTWTPAACGVNPCHAPCPTCAYTLNSCSYSAAYMMKRTILDSGGGASSNPAYIMKSQLLAPAAGRMTNGEYTMTPGVKYFR